MDGQDPATDTGGLDEAFRESLSDAGGEPTAEDPTPEPETETEDSPVEEETRFTDDDPDDLPAELQSKYKSFQRAFTKKTQAISQKSKELDQKLASLGSWAQFIERYNADPSIRERMEAAFRTADAAADKAGVKTADEFEAFLDQYDEPSQKLLRALGQTVTKQASKAVSEEVERIKKANEALTSQLSETRRQLDEREAAIQQRRFEKAHPDWKEQLSPRQQKLFMQELMEDLDADPIEVYESILDEFDKGATKKADDKVRSLVERAGNKPVRTPARAARGVERYETMDDAFKASLREVGR